MNLYRDGHGPWAAELRAAVLAARLGGEAAMPFYGRAVATAKEGGSPVTDADHASNRAVVQALRAAFPADAVLSEESADTPERLRAARVWIVDPLDGTREFLARNGEFAVMVGLAMDGRAVLGAVFLPALGTLYYAAEGAGAWAERGNGPLRLQAPAGGTPPRLVGSRSHPDPLLAAIQAGLGAGEVQPAGSVGLKCARVVEGHSDLYVHPVPYLREWDTCAPEVVVREAGGTVTDCLGAPLRYNKPDPVQPHGIVAAAPGLSEAALAVITPLYADGRGERG